MGGRQQIAGLPLICAFPIVQYVYMYIFEKCVEGPIVFVLVTQDTDLSSAISTKLIHENFMKSSQTLHRTHLNIQLG